MNPLAEHILKIEEGINSLGIDPKEARAKTANRWHFNRGKASIIVFLQHSKTFKQEEVHTLILVSPLIKMPSNIPLSDALNRYLMQRNHQLVTERFSLLNDTIYINSTAYLKDLSAKGIAHLLDSLSYYAEVFLQDIQSFLKKQPLTSENPPAETTEENILPFEMHKKRINNPFDQLLEE